MKQVLNFIILILLLSLTTSVYGQTVFINEIHYDNTGGDVNEGFEITALAGTDLSCYSIVLYNGGTTTSYTTIALSGIVPDEGCGYGAIWFSYASGIQNGAPDGICLYNNCSFTVIQFLSYEGSFTATNNVASGITSTDIGVTETGTEPIGQSLQLTGNGNQYGDFTWTGPVAETPGTLNAGQNMCATCGDAICDPTEDYLSCP